LVALVDAVAKHLVDAPSAPLTIMPHGCGIGAGLFGI